jgi:DNA-binding transcriptional regulator GbsR (MarR family)
MARTGIDAERTPTAEELVAQAASTLFRQWGFRTSTGVVWSALFLSDKPLSAAQLQDILSISAGSLNNALRELARWGFIYREASGTDRRFYYRAETDLWLVINKLFRERERRRLSAALEQIAEAEKLLGEGRHAEGQGSYRLEQVRRLGNVGAFVISLLDAFMERTRVELKAAQKWLEVAERLGGEPLSRLRRALKGTRK